ncbi:MAG: ABC transporter permease, partial [Acidobacteriota bacterium]
MTLSALNRKLFRDLWAVRGQVIAIALVLAGGIATYVMAASTLRAMRDTQTRMYREFRFPDLFASLKRAPLSLASRVRQLPGIIEVETRTAAPANISLAGFSQPVSGLIIGLPASGPILNLLHLHAGRLPDPNADHEAIVSDGFAQAHKLNPGFRLEVTIEGRRQTLTVVGIVSTPEFTYQIAPGSLVPDFTTYCIL